MARTQYVVTGNKDTIEFDLFLDEATEELSKARKSTESPTETVDNDELILACDEDDDSAQL